MMKMDVSAERYQVVYGATLLIDDGAQVPAGTTIAEWDPFAIPILTEVGGAVKFQRHH